MGTRRWVLRCALGLVLVGCGDDTAAIDSGTDAPMDAAADTASPPDARADAGDDAPMPMNAEERLGWPGPHPVGYREYTFTYERSDGGGSREILLMAWYPAEGITSESRVVNYSIGNRGTAYQQVPMRDGRYPVLAYSHGHQALADSSASIFEHFASHGWVVISPRHTGNGPSEPDRETDIYYLRPEDVSESLTFALDSELGPLMDTPRVIGGHSFGAYTAYALAGATYDVDAIVAGCLDDDFGDVCNGFDDAAQARFRAGFEDDRFDAVLAMAAGDYRLLGDGVAAIDIPVFQMVAEGDGHPAGSADADEYWTSLDGVDDLRFNLLAGAHNSFTDICVALPGFLRCSEEDPREELALVKLYSLAFVADRLMESADGAEVLAGTHTRVELTAR